MYQLLLGFVDHGIGVAKFPDLLLKVVQLLLHLQHAVGVLVERLGSIQKLGRRLHGRFLAATVCRIWYLTRI